MENRVIIKSIQHVTHDVLCIVTEKPPSFDYFPGQAVDVVINKTGWLNEKRPFTFTSLPAYDYLEFTIKTYPAHQGVTNELLKLKPQDELIVSDVFGTIGYQDEGLFLAGGAGITPFIAIFRDLLAKNKIGNNKLLFANKTKADIIREDEFKKQLGKNFINVLSGEQVAGYEHGFISEALIGKHYVKGQYVYLCGPDPMMDALGKLLDNLKVPEKLIVKESF